jgi:hypothetical protein
MTNSDGLRSLLYLLECADLIAAAGHSSWLTQREDKIQAKGKGELDTFWLKLGTPEGQADEKNTTKHNRHPTDMSEGFSSAYSFTDVFDDELVSSLLPERTLRLIRWNVEVLFGLLRKMILNRQKADTSQARDIVQPVSPSKKEANYLRELEDAIPLLPKSQCMELSDAAISCVVIEPSVARQLHDLITK